jgi:enamine deaminase RidA (YjgF/YER057c/UK114 family)
MTIDRYAVINAPGRPVMSLGIATGDWFTFCTTATNRPADIKDQTRQVLTAFDRYLAEAGTDKSKLLTAQVWLRHMADYEAMNEVWNAWVDPENPPTRACARADMARPDTLVEIRITAAR